MNYPNSMADLDNSPPEYDPSPLPDLSEFAGIHAEPISYSSRIDWRPFRNYPLSMAIAANFDQCGTMRYAAGWVASRITALDAQPGERIVNSRTGETYRRNFGTHHTTADVSGLFDLPPLETPHPLPLRESWGQFFKHNSIVLACLQRRLVLILGSNNCGDIVRIVSLSGMAYLSWADKIGSNMPTMFDFEATSWKPLELYFLRRDEVLPALRLLLPPGKSWEGDYCLPLEELTELALNRAPTGK